MNRVNPTQEGRLPGDAAFLAEPRRAQRDLSLPRALVFWFLPALRCALFLLLAAWKTSSQRYRHWLLTAFVTMYGATIAIRYDPTGQGADGVRHLLLVYDHYVG